MGGGEEGAAGGCARGTSATRRQPCHPGHGLHLIQTHEGAGLWGRGVGGQRRGPPAVVAAEVVTQRSGRAGQQDAKRHGVVRLLVCPLVFLEVFRAPVRPWPPAKEQTRMSGWRRVAAGARGQDGTAACRAAQPQARAFAMLHNARITRATAAMQETSTPHPRLRARPCCCCRTGGAAHRPALPGCGSSCSSPSPGATAVAARRSGSNAVSSRCGCCRCGCCTSSSPFSSPASSAPCRGRRGLSCPPSALQ